MSSLAELGISVRANGPEEQRVPCSRCGKGPSDKALGVNIESGAFHCFRCGWSGRAEVGETRAGRKVARLDDPRIGERKRARLRRLWSESLPLAHPGAHAVRRYLAARGLAAVLAKPSEALRAHPALSYYEGAQEIDRFPAMLALFTSAEGSAATLHATYLAANGHTKAPVRAPKKLLPVPIRGSTRRGAIRLYRADHGVLGLAEGVETALSLSLLQGVPVWAAGCADRLAEVRLPRSLRKLYIAADVDASGKGEQSARALAERVHTWKPRVEVYIITPDGEGVRDLNDELRRRAG